MAQVDLGEAGRWWVCADRPTNRGRGNRQRNPSVHRRGVHSRIDSRGENPNRGEWPQAQPLRTTRDLYPRLSTYPIPSRWLKQ